MILKLIFLAWILAFVCIVVWGKKSFHISDMSIKLPNDFLDLNRDLRKKALHFSWTLGLSHVSSITFQTIGNKIIAGVALFLSFIIFIPNFIYGLELIILHKETSSSEKIYSVLIFSIWAVISLSLLVFYYVRKKNTAMVAEQERAKRVFNKKLQSLGVTFVKENVITWVNEMDKIIKPKALDESQVKDVVSFTLLSHDFSIEPSGMPPKNIDVTYLFSNGFLSVVSGVIFDVMETSYSYLNSDTPNYFGNTQEEWILEEFHYSDVVEVIYQPNVNLPDYVKMKNNEASVEGYLIFSLVNASIKYFPTTKKAADNFISLARQKVRATKIRAI